MKVMVFGIAICCAIGSASSAMAWSVGDEKEVGAGVYVKLVSSSDGWDVWSTETKSGKSCQALKGVNGKRYLPYKSIFFGSPVGLNLKLSEGQTVWSIWHSASPPSTKAEFRLKGDKFYEEVEPVWSASGSKNASQFAKVKALSGQDIEVHTVDYEYPEIFVGREEHNEVISTFGMSAAEDALISCAVN